jgi:hypothetical protein
MTVEQSIQTLSAENEKTPTLNPQPTQHKAKMRIQRKNPASILSWQQRKQTTTLMSANKKMLLFLHQTPLCNESTG